MVAAIESFSLGQKFNSVCFTTSLGYMFVNRKIFTMRAEEVIKQKGCTQAEIAERLRMTQVGLL